MERIEKGQANLGMIFGMLSFVIILIVGTIIFSNFDTQASTLVTVTAASASVANLTSNTYNGLNIMSIAPIVLAAIIILGVVSLLSRAR